MRRSCSCAIAVIKMLLRQIFIGKIIKSSKLKGIDTKMQISYQKKTITTFQDMFNKFTNESFEVMSLHTCQAFYNNTKFQMNLGQLFKFLLKC